ncbi:MAG: lysophospholipid acyltransferase family protein [Candidatus Omnitrophota bacterium]
MIRLVFRLFFFKITVKGASNIPKEGACVIASSHIGHIDPYLLTTIFPREMAFMTGLNVFLRFIARAFVGDCIAATGPMAIVEACRRIANGRMVLFFPEGGRNETGHPIEGKPGAALAALRTGTKILPVKITGTDEALNIRKCRVKFGAKIGVSIGTPILLDGSYDTEPIWAGAKEATKLIMQRIDSLE